MNEQQIVQQAWQIGYERGKADARCQCDVCPGRAWDGLPVLVSGRDIMRRPAVEN